MEPLSSQPRPEHTTHFGRFGLRAGWSILAALLLYYLLTMILTPIFLTATGTHQQAVAEATAVAAAQPIAIGARLTIATEAAVLAAVAITTFALSRIERRKLSVYGIGRSRLLDILPGAFTGLATLSLLIAALHTAHALVFDTQALHGAAIYLSGAKWLLAFLIVGLFEESSTRGFLQYTLMRGLIGLGERISPQHARAIAFWLAAVIMSILFGYLHIGNPGETTPGIAMVFCAGLLFSYALWRTGSLWWAIGFHTTWDWAQSFLYGVPDSGSLSNGRLFLTHPAGSTILSGGIDGPEGSILVLPTLLLVALIIRFTTRPGPQPPLEPDTPSIA
jgi:membrane protease YdiL (CAAX protease family)